jgi:hypothetical protein
MQVAGKVRLENAILDYGKIPHSITRTILYSIRRYEHHLVHVIIIFIS